ncbi:glycosyl transferase [Spirosoma sp. SC4-14]|uniref:glycosyl transferase n=1 Tax=Spirosoma sp. SC4-14 TaxID=3128900 RepID=UPI0030D3D5FE
MTLAFTICSINYLAQARTLGDSLKQTNPDYQYVIGLVDKLNGANLPADLLPAYTMLEVDQIDIPDFKAMCDRYDITELNTAVKPYYIDFFFKHYPEATEVIYFDPDIIVFQPLDVLNTNLKQYSLVLTPHICSPTPDWERPNEQHHLNTGIFNLGFIGLRKDSTSQHFIDWWKQRLAYECRNDLCNGLFVDQQWVNFAPLYYDNVWIEKHMGYNVAYWNLHERHLSADQTGQWWVNETELLQFFHYSGYSPYRPNDVSKYQTRYTFDETEIPGIDRSDAKPLFDLYRNQLLLNHNEQYRSYPCIYIKPPVVLRYKRVRKLINTPFNQLIALLETQ